MNGISIANSHQWVHSSASNSASYRVTLTLPLFPVDGPVPLLVILDGDTMLHTATETSRTITASTMGALGQAAFVGVMRDVPLGLEYMSTRFADFTPTEWTLPGPFSADNAMVQHGTGGAGAFLDTIVDGILPEVRHIVQADESRIGVCGWSLSGLFAAHAWLTRPDVFSDLVAISPSLWWDDAGILASPVAPRPRPSKVLVTAGEHEEGDISRVWPQSYFNVQNRETIAQQRDLAAMVRNARTFGTMATASGADSRTVVLEGEHHVTLVPASISRALIHLYG